jgi:hypothetical protein
MTTRTAHALRLIGDALRNLAGGALLAGGFIALLWLTELATIP